MVFNINVNQGEHDVIIFLLPCTVTLTEIYEVICRLRHHKLVHNIKIKMDEYERTKRLIKSELMEKNTRNG